MSKNTSQALIKLGNAVNSDTQSLTTEEVIVLLNTIVNTIVNTSGNFNKDEVQASITSNTICLSAYKQNALDIAGKILENAAASTDKVCILRNNIKSISASIGIKQSIW